MSNDEKLPLSVGSALERERERMVRLRESKEMTAPAKPDIDEQIARAKRDVDLAAGWLAANQTDVEAQHNYQFCVSILATLEAHKRIIEAAEVPEPVAWMWEEYSFGYDRWETKTSIHKPNIGQHERNLRPLYTAPQQEPVMHPDDAAIDKFAAAMKAKMAKKREEGRGGWDDPEQCSIDYLTRLFHDHVQKGDPVDIGNFAMMLWHRISATSLPAQYRRIPAPQPADGVVVPIETLIIMRAAITEDSPLGKRAIAAYEKLKAERRNLLAAYDRVAAEYRKSGGTNKYEGHTLHEWWERAINAERQLARCQKECEEQARLNGMGSEREARLMAQLAELRESEGG